MMNREQIVKALECCSDGGRCNDCPYDSDCFIPQWVIVKDALALVRELTEENDRLSRTRYMVSPDGRTEMIPSVESVKADTVRKMQERFSMILDVGEEIATDTAVDFLDAIAKEMLEEK